MKHSTCSFIERTSAQSPKRTQSWRLLAFASLIAIPACADEPDDGCEATRDTYEFSEDTSIGFTMSEVLANRRGQTSTLSWAEPRDWLEHSADGDTELIVRVMPREGEDVEEIRNESTDCFRILQTTVDVQITTEDGQLDTTVEGTVTAFSQKRFEVVAELTSKDLEGELQISSSVRLQLKQTVNGDDVTGTLFASTESESSVRSFELATWTGSVGAPELPAPTTDDSPTDDAPTDDSPTDDAPTDDSPTDDAPTDVDAGPAPVDEDGGSASGDAGPSSSDGGNVPGDSGSTTEAGTPADDSGAPAEADAGDAG